MHESAEVFPELWRELLPVLSRAELPVRVPGNSGGPRSWWAGPLDVEGLALSSMEAVAVALHAYAESSNLDLDVSFTSESVAASFASFTHLKVNGQSVPGFAPLSGFRRSADGWVRLHANYPHHANALLAALAVPDPESVDAALLEHPSADIEAVVKRSGGVAVRVRTPEEWASGPGADALRDEPWIRFGLREACGEASGQRLLPVGNAASGLPLAGIRILDLSRVVAGPAATRLLGALGADVLRIDPPQMPELLDMYLDSGFDKRSAFADLTDPAQRSAVHELLHTADAVLLGYRGGALTKFGLDAESLRDLRPELPVVILDAWGDRGPWASRRGFDSIVQAATGISTVYGSGSGDEWQPGALPVQALDHAVGMGSAAATISLLAAHQKGITGSAHLSLARTALELLAWPTPSDIRTGQNVEPELEVPLRHASGHYGDLVFVPPPLLLNGRQLEYRQLPGQHGSSPLAWLPRQAHGQSQELLRR